MKCWKISLVFLSIITACSVKDEEYLNVETQEGTYTNYTFNFEDFTIPIDSLTLPYYPVFQKFYFNNDFIVGYNKFIHSLDFFDLTSMTFYKHLLLKKEGPQKVSSIYGFYFINWDSILVFSSDLTLNIIDSSGNIFYKKDFKVLTKMNKGSIGATNESNIYYSKNRKSIIFRYTPRNVTWSSKSFFRIPFLCEFKVNEDKISLLPVYYSNYFVKNNSIGYSFLPCVTFQNNTIYYCFRGESNIYTYDLESQLHNTFGGRSKFSKNTADPIPSSYGQTRINRHELVSVKFMNILYDPYRNVFYRLHLGNQDYQIGDNLFNTFYDKKIFLMIFDSKFRLIKELALDDYTFQPEFYCVTQQGLLLNSNHKLNKLNRPNIIQFKLLKINKNEDN